MNKMFGIFWTNEKEMEMDIERFTNYDVLAIYDGFITVINRTLDDDKTIDIEVIRANRTMTLRAFL